MTQRGSHAAGNSIWQKTIARPWRAIIAWADKNVHAFEIFFTFVIAVATVGICWGEYILHGIADEQARQTKSIQLEIAAFELSHIQSELRSMNTSQAMREHALGQILALYERRNRDNPENKEHADLRWAQLQQMNHPDMNFQKADLSNADLTGAQLPRANFDDTTLDNAVFKDACLTNSSFKGAKASDLSKVLQGAHLLGATGFNSKPETLALDFVTPCKPL